MANWLEIEKDQSNPHKNKEFVMRKHPKYRNDDQDKDGGEEEREAMSGKKSGKGIYELVLFGFCQVLSLNFSCSFHELKANRRRCL